MKKRKGARKGEQRALKGKAPRDKTFNVRCTSAEKLVYQSIKKQLDRKRIKEKFEESIDT